MEQNNPYFANVHVPEAVLLTKPTQAITLLNPLEHGAFWYKAHADQLCFTPEGAVSEWHPMGDAGGVALPVTPNTEHLRLSETGGLQFMRKVNAGLVLEDALHDPERFSLAVRFHAQGEARTLLTINPKDHDTYLFLNEKAGRISWQDQNNTAAVSLPSPEGRGGWGIASFNAGVLSLALAAEGAGVSPPVLCDSGQAELAAALRGANDLFIGCRSHRKGILKTLGESQIHDLLLWPDHDVFEADQTRLTAICRYCEAKGTGNGL